MLYQTQSNWSDNEDHRSTYTKIKDSLESISLNTLADWSNFFAGWADGLTFGLTGSIREGLGYDDVVDRASGAYGTGALVGTVHTMLLPGGGIGGGIRNLNRAGMVLDGLEKGIQGVADGDPLKALKGFGDAAGGGFLKTDLCKMGNKLAALGIKGTMIAGGVAHGIDAVDSFAKGDVIGGLSSAAQGMFLAAQGSRACFVAGTPLRTADGSKAIESLRSFEDHGEGCDYVLSRSEFDPEGPLELRRVLRQFVRVSPVLNLSVGGQVIGTTAEHPFFAEGRGWMPAGELKVGDRLALHDGDWLKVDGVADSGRVLTVYNVEVEGFHTYFVGSTEWGFAVWAHNASLDGCGGNIRRAQQADLLAQPGINITRTQNHHPFFRMFRDSIDRAGVGPMGMRTRSGRMRPQRQQTLENRQHGNLHQDWNDFVGQNGLHPALRAVEGGRTALTRALRNQEITSYQIYRHMEQFYMEYGNMAALRSLRSYGKRVGLDQPTLF